MATHRHFDRICCGILLFTLLLTLLCFNAKSLGVQEASAAIGYEQKIFDTSTVHTIDIVMDNWETFLANCTSEEYYSCTVVIDNEACKNVAIRGKGNTSLTQVASYGNDRYSFKIEFDHYDETNTYYGLDKLCLNNIIQDNTYMKDYLTYQLMNEMGVASPLCSYAYLTVNGEDWGLYLAVEGVEESFLQRNFGSNYGELYKPDTSQIGGNNGGSPQGGSSEDVLLKYIDNDFESYSNIFDNAKTDLSDSDKTRLITALKNLVDQTALADTVAIDSVIRYFVVHNFVLNFDSYTGSMIHNYYLYESDGQLQMIPWDYNLAFEGFQSSGDADSLVNYPIDTPVSGSSTEDRPMLAWIFSDETYTDLYHQYFSEFIETVFESGAFEETIEQISALISPYVEKDPTKFCTYEEFQTGVSTLKEFCLLRAESIRGQLEGTIGSTSDTQDTATLISAGDLQIADMGSMNNRSSDNNTPPGSEDNGDASIAETFKDNNQDRDQSNGQMQPPETPDGNTEKRAPFGDPSGSDDMKNSETMKDTETAQDSGQWILLGVSAAVLLFGLIFALIFKRRK